MLRLSTSVNFLTFIVPPATCRPVMIVIVRTITNIHVQCTNNNKYSKNVCGFHFVKLLCSLHWPNRTDDLHSSEWGIYTQFPPIGFPLQFVHFHTLLSIIRIVYSTNKIRHNFYWKLIRNILIELNYVDNFTYILMNSYRTCTEDLILLLNISRRAFRS